MSPSDRQLIESVFVGNSEMAAHMRALDWSTTAIGPVEQWPQALRTGARIILGAVHAIAICWGPDFVLLYNDAAGAFIGAMHPWALGRSIRDVLPEAWESVGPLYNAVLQGQSFSLSDQLVPMNRNGYLEEYYATYSLSPIPQDDGRPGGFMSMTFNSTERVLEDRRRNLLRDLAVRTAAARTEEEVWRVSAETIGENCLSLPFAFLYEYRPSEHQAYLAGASIETDESLRPSVVDCRGENLWQLNPALSKDGILIELGDRASSVPVPNWTAPPRQVFVAPIRLGEFSEPLGFFVAGLHPGRAFDDAYRQFIYRITEQLTIGLTSARAYEQERKRAEALAELDRAKTTFFSNVSHEFRTPLALMLGPLDEVLAHERLEPQGHEQLVTVRRNGLRLLKLVNTLLDFSRIEAGRVQASYEPTDLAHFTREIASAFDSAMQSAGLRFSVECLPIADPVYVDRDMWEKIVLNLLSNAYKFTFAGEVALTLKPVGGGVELEIRDTGVGIPEQHIEHVFERFHRIESTQARTYEGSGIGLALVEELVKQHGGSVRAVSAVGTGSTFTVTIPTGKGHLQAERIQTAQTLAPTTIRAEAFVEEARRWSGGKSDVALDERMPGKRSSFASQPEPQAKEKRELIVVADDNADMRQYLARLLSEQYEVHAVVDGREALEATERLRPALVLADVMMPHLDGFGLLRAIRNDSVLAATPVVLLSARAGEESRVEGLEADADDYLIKPFAARELLARVAANVKMSKLRRETAEREERMRSEAELEREKLRASEEQLAQTSRLYEELRRADAELQLQAGLLHRLPVSAWTLNPDGTPDFVNQVWLDFAGQTRDFVQSHPEAWMTAVHPEDREAAAKAFWDGIRAGQSFAIETRSLRAQDGTYRWHLQQAVVLRDEQGNVLKFVGTTTDIDDLKRAEEKLRESEYEARLTVDSIPGMVALASPTGNIEMVSRPVLEFFGHPIEEINQWGTNDMIHPEDLPGVVEAFSRAISTGSPYEFPMRLRRWDGVYRWFQDRGAPLRNRNGDIARWYLLITDIDDQKRAEEALRESEYESRLIIDSIPGLTAALSANGELEFLSQPILDYYGKTLDEVKLLWATGDLIHPQDLPRLLDVFTHSISSGDPLEIELRCKRFDGAYLWFVLRGRPVRDRQGHIVRWYFLQTDIDDRKRAEEALRESEHESRLIVDSIPGLIAVLSVSGEIEAVNQPILDYFGRSLDDLRQWAVDDTIHPDDRPGYLQAFARSFASGEPVEYEAVRVRRHDGVYRWFNMRGLPLHDRQGHIVRWYFLLADVDDRKRAEDALRQAQGDLARINRVTTMGELAASLAHEVNQPIGGVLINAGVCLRKLGHDYPDIEEARAAVTRIHRDAQRAADVIGKIRSQFEKAAPNREVLDINEIIRETAGLLRSEASRYNILVRTELAADLPQIVGDRVQLQQVAMNLIVNSLEAMKDVDGIRELAIKSQLGENEQLLVTVSDTGMGFPPQLAEQIFDPFFTTKPHGTGMGLRISRSIIESHGGRLWAADSPERGATFHLNLPPATAPNQ